MAVIRGSRSSMRDTSSAIRPVSASVQLGQHPADVVAQIAFDFQDERGRSPRGIVRLPAQELARDHGVLEPVLQRGRGAVHVRLIAEQWDRIG